jgi:hypothetical protein
MAAPSTRRVATRTVLSKSLEIALQAMLLVVLPATLGPVGYGQFALVVSLVGGVSLGFSLGGPVVFGRFVPAAGEEERKGVARTLVRRFARWRACVLLVLAAGVLVLLVTTPSVPAGFAVLALVVLAIELAAALVHWAALGLGQTLPWNLRFPVQHAVLLVGCVVIDDAKTAVAVLGIAVAVSATLAVPAILSLRGARPAAIPAGALKFGRLSAATALLVNVPQRAGVLAVTLLADVGAGRQAGFAGVAYGIALAGIYAASELFTVQLASNSAAFRGAPEAATARVVTGAWVLLGVFSIGAALASFTVALLLVPLVGAAFTGAMHPTQIALAALPLAVVSGAATQVSALRLQPALRLRSATVGFVTYVAVAALAVPGLGALGSSWALVACFGSASLLQGTRPALVPWKLVATGWAAAALLLGLSAAY